MQRLAGRPLVHATFAGGSSHVCQICFPRSVRVRFTLGRRSGRRGALQGSLRHVPRCRQRPGPHSQARRTGCPDAGVYFQRHVRRSDGHSSRGLERGRRPRHCALPDGQGIFRSQRNHRRNVLGSRDKVCSRKRRLEWMGRRAGQLALPAQTRTQFRRCPQTETEVGLRIPGRQSRHRAAHRRGRPRLRWQRQRNRIFIGCRHRMHLLDLQSRRRRPHRNHHRTVENQRPLHRLLRRLTLVHACGGCRNRKSHLENPAGGSSRIPHYRRAGVLRRPAAGPGGFARRRLGSSAAI